jgi:hypothetical protein
MTHAKALLLALLLVSGMIVSPVCAITTFEQIQMILDSHVVTANSVTSYTYDGSPDGDAVYRVQFTVPRDSYVNFTLYYGTDQSVSGSAQSTGSGGINPLETTSYVTLNGVTKAYTFWDTDPWYDYDIAGYGVNSSSSQTGFMVYSRDYNALLLGNDLAVGYLVSDIAHNLIYKVTFSGPQPFDLTYTSAKRDEIISRVNAGTSTGLLEQVQQILSIGSAVLDTLLNVLLALIHWVKFFFFDNIGMTVALYLAISMAYTASSSKNIFMFFKKFLNDQKKFFEFILGLWKIIADTIGTIRGWFRL